MSSVKLVAGRRSRDVIVDRPSVDSAVKAAALQVSPSIVTVITHHVPDDMILKGRRPLAFRSEGAYVCPGSGVIIESETHDAIYFSTILCPANLFKRTNDIQPHQIQVDVHVSDGSLHKAELLDCDFHYNIAAIRVQTEAALQPAILRHLTDITSLQPHVENPFKLQRHSYLNPFKVEFGTKILVAKRSCGPTHYEIIVSAGVFRPASHDELFSIRGSKVKCGGGGVIINYHGEVIGICFSNATFFPSNLVSRWWDHYKSCKDFRRPCFGVKLANLYEARIDFLERFVREFPKTVTGILVTKVVENSPAHQCGVECDDVIITCNDNPTRNKLEFFEKVWDYTGGVVRMDVLRAKNGGRLKLEMAMGETGPDKFYEWDLPDWQNFGNYNA